MHKLEDNKLINVCTKKGKFFSIMIVPINEGEGGNLYKLIVLNSFDENSIGFTTLYYVYKNLNEIEEMLVNQNQLKIVGVQNYVSNYQKRS